MKRNYAVEIKKVDESMEDNRIYGQDARLRYTSLQEEN